MRTQTVQTLDTYVINAMCLQTQREHNFYILTDHDIPVVTSRTMDVYRPYLIKNIRSISALVKTLIHECTDFEYLRDQWYIERGAASSISQIAMCQSYQRIIAKGPAVIPHILRQMEAEGDEPDMWFWALRVLTDTDPVSEEDRGDFPNMAKAWLKWASTRYVW
jgi:hypothetical protein